ncbi:unnamed protein product [Protopolystoma xenopodis]|uniref:Uncharacterized protein n=1 Tax=Protopolystoma xenopodis TaxID=117903 RepID=A0A3S5CG36_9PLAT|nr:unnamed protein product [Protopolystoma xenopodis]
MSQVDFFGRCPASFGHRATRIDHLPNWAWQSLICASTEAKKSFVRQCLADHSRPLKPWFASHDPAHKHTFLALPVDILPVADWICLSTTSLEVGKR